jgi:hypothetical protein
MSRRTSRIAALAVTLATVGAMSVTVAPASAFSITSKFKNWVLSGSLTPKKLGSPVNLPEGSTFNGEAIAELPTFDGTVTGNVSVPPFKASVKLLGIIPTTIGVTFEQVGSIAGTIHEAPQEDCPNVEPGASGSKCVTLSVPTEVKLGITEVGLFGLGVKMACETAEAATLDLSTDLSVGELFSEGSHFTGTTTIPPIKCAPGKGLGILGGPILTSLLSGPDNAYALNITPPA